MNRKEFDEALPGVLPALLQYALSLTRDRSEAEDRVQECVQRCLVYQHRLPDVFNLRAYLFTTLRNVHFDFLRQRHQEGVLVDFSVISPRLAVLPVQGKRIQFCDVVQEISRLPPEQRDVVVLISSGMGYNQVAKTLGVPRGTVMSRLFRVRKRLRLLLKD